MTWCNSHTPGPASGSGSGIGGATGGTSPTGGFSLMELLIVLAIVALTMAVVAPDGWRMLERTAAHMDRMRDAAFLRKAEFTAFSRDQDCGLFLDGIEWTLACGNATIATRNATAPYDNGSTGDEAQNAETVLFISRKGATRNATDVETEQLRTAWLGDDDA